MATMTPLKFLILDEHTAALDPKTAEVIMALTDRVIREKHLTAMMVTHNLRYAVEYGDRILMMNRGRVVLDRAGAEKRATSMDDILTMFNQISGDRELRKKRASFGCPPFTPFPAHSPWPSAPVGSAPHGRRPGSPAPWRPCRLPRRNADPPGHG